MRAFAYLWASPATLLGLTAGLLGLLTGGKMQHVTGVLEFWGGACAWLLRRAPLGSGGAMALTLGHTVLAQTQAAHDVCRGHERVHVRQYERWGPFFLPAYLSCALVLGISGRNPYRDNPFEREAFDHDARVNESNEGRLYEG